MSMLVLELERVAMALLLSTLTNILLQKMVNIRDICMTRNYNERNIHLKQTVNIYTSDDTDHIWQAIKTSMTKCMKDFILTINLDCNLLKHNTLLCNKNLARVRGNKSVGKCI